MAYTPMNPDVESYYMKINRYIGETCNEDASSDIGHDGSVFNVLFNDGKRVVAIFDGSRKDETPLVRTYQHQVEGYCSIDNLADRKVLIKEERMSLQDYFQLLDGLSEEAEERQMEYFRSIRNTL